MALPTRTRRTRRVDFQASIMAAIMVIISCLCIYFYTYNATYSAMINDLTERVASIYMFVEDYLDKDTFSQLRSPEDMDTASYQNNHRVLQNVRFSTGVRYLYTATKDENGDFIYLLDGLPLSEDGTPVDPADFRRPGDIIEAEIVPELERAMEGEAILPSEIKDTEWGKIFISYLPVHDGDKIVGVVGVEFEAEEQYNTYSTLRLVTPIIICSVCLLSSLLALYFFRHISNPSYRDLANTDQLTQLKSRNAFAFDLHNLEVQRNKASIGILLTDLNNLKQVNDTLGHEAGDEYICLAARAITETETEGVAYRVGGDEFAVILPHTDEEGLAALAKKLEKAFDAIRPHWEIDTSLAMGWALFSPYTDRDLEETFHRADEDMYRAKRAYHEMDQDKKQ